MPARETARMATSSDMAVLGSSAAIERALSRFGWLGDHDDLLAKLGIGRDKLRAIEADDEVAAALETRRDACLNTPHRIEHPQARARTFYESQLPALHVPMRAAWAATLYGYSVVEIVYARRDDGRIGIAQALECPFEWFRVEPDGTLKWAESGRSADPRKFFAFVRDGSIRKPHGDALLAKAYWPWFFRVHGWKFWAKFLEQAAVPLLYGKTQGDKQGLVDLLKTVTGGPVAAINQDDSLDAMDMPGNSPNKFAEFETACVRRIQRLILGQTLTSGTDGGSGNRALGEVHNEVRNEKRRADIRLVTGAVERVLATLAALNGMEPPVFVMQDDTGLERARADRDAVLTGAGMLRFSETYLREKYALEPDDFTVPAAPAPAANPAMAARFGLDNPAKADRPRFTAGQQVIEDEVERTLSRLGSPVDAAAIAAAIRHASNPEDLIERLGVALADADDRAFRRALESALFAADLTGYAHAK